jgi:hypothetical protein
MAGNRAASANATALVARLVADNVPVTGDDARALREACGNVDTLGVHFGAQGGVGQCVGVIAGFYWSFDRYV